MFRSLEEIIRESARLAFILGGLGLTAVVFWHAESGLPLTVMTKKNESAAATLSGKGEAERPAAVLKQPREAAEKFSAELPKNVLISVPFTPQAPFANWGDPYNEACEEASVIMAQAWVSGNKFLAPAKVDAEIKSLVSFEKYYFGYHKDTAARETAKLLTEFYGYPGVLVRYSIGLDDVKAELASGRIVILPVRGAALENPYFLGPPPYHMIVAVGYDDESEELIVHDPGTRRGKEYRYPYRIFDAALHDWPGSDAGLEESRSAMIAVYPQGERLAR